MEQLETKVESCWHLNSCWMPLVVIEVDSSVLVVIWGLDWRSLVAKVILQV
jgi:hypothetical protein